MSLLSPEVTATYEVLSPMGEGGMGAVYKVRHRVFNEICVIKVMKTDLQNDPKQRQRFEAEAIKGKQLQHRNIARVLNFFIGSNGYPHLVMEYVDGSTLRDVLERTTVLDTVTATTIGLQTLAGLSCLHANRLVHRDLSPDNLILARDVDGTYIVKIIDLGIAKAMDETSQLTKAGMFIGKPSYAAPEQFGGRVDARSDLYSLGVVLYELTTGELPVDIRAVGHIFNPPRPFSDSDPHNRVPELLRQVILRALEKDPERRYQSSGEFATALSATLAPLQGPTIRVPGFSVPEVQPDDTPKPNVETVRTRPTPVRRGLYAGATLTLSVAILVFLWVQQIGDKPPLQNGEAALVATQSTTGTELTVTAPDSSTVSMPALTTNNPTKPATDASVPPEPTPSTPTSAAALTRGKEFIAAGNPRAAYDAFRQAAQADPANALAWANLGGAARLLGKTTEAERALERAVQLDGENWLAHYNLACHYARAGRTEDAFDELRTGVVLMRQQSAPATVETITRRIRADSALETLRNAPRFEEILAAP